MCEFYHRSLDDNNDDDDDGKDHMADMLAVELAHTKKRPRYALSTEQIQL